MMWNVRTINEHIQKIYVDGELTEKATIRNFRIVQTEGSHQVNRRIPMTMQDWSQRLNRFLEFNEHNIIRDIGWVTFEIAKTFAESEFEKYRLAQEQLFESDFGRFLALEEMEKNAKDI